MDAEAILTRLSATAKAKADERSLREMRTILAEPEFQRQLKEFVSRAHNQPDARAEIAFILREARFSFSANVAISLSLVGRGKIRSAHWHAATSWAEHDSNKRHFRPILLQRFRSFPPFPARELR